MSGFWTLRRRILATIVALLLVTVGSTMVVLYWKLQDAAARGEYLSKHMNRYLGYQQAGTEALLAAAGMAGSDEALSAALGTGDRAGVERARRRLAAALSAALGLEWFVVLDGYMDVVASFGDVSGLAGAGKLLAAAVRGSALSGPALLPGGQVAVVAAVPVTVEGRVVGAVAAGQDLSVYLSRYSKDSDQRKEMQHQLALVVGGEVLAATVAPESRKELTAGLAQKRTVKEGDVDATVFTFEGRNWDVDGRPFSALTAEGVKEVGTLTLFRLRKSYETRVSDNLYPVVWVGLGGVLLAVLFAFLVARTITRPIRVFNGSLRELIEGEADLTRRVPVEGKDELAALGSTINELFERFHQMVWRIREASLRLAQSSQEISHVAMRTHEGAHGQVARIENSTSLSNELSRTIQEIAARANQGAQIAGLGKDSVQKTDAGMNGIMQAVHLSWNNVRRLKENVEKIGAIAELISKITEENSMLALNASIEAARAGAAGQGFAVVAQQMREQARRVDKNSKEISENIRMIQQTTGELVKSMEEARTDVDSGGQLVNITLHHLSELSTIMQETAESVKEQAAASDDIARTMAEVQRVSRDALEASEQTVQEGGSIRDRAQELSLLVGRFRVKELAAGEVSERALVPLPHEEKLE